jgi:hypothetical protein
MDLGIKDSRVIQMPHSGANARVTLISRGDGQATTKLNSVHYKVSRYAMTSSMSSRL